MIEVQIEPASGAEADVAASLSFMAYHEFSYDIFGKVGERAATEYFKRLWLHGENRFGYKYSYIAKVRGNTVGIMTCYPSPYIKTLTLPTFWQLMHVGGATFLFHFLAHLSNFYHFSSTREFHADEFYVATLSVLPEYRGMGIGGHLLRHAFRLTLEQVCTHCTLHVNADNEGGIRFYERNGFIKDSPLSQQPAYFRMVYSL